MSLPEPWTRYRIRNSYGRCTGTAFYMRDNGVRILLSTKIQVGSVTMNIYTPDQAAANGRGRTADPVHETQRAHAPSVGMVENSPAASTLQRYQQMADNSPQVLQLKHQAVLQRADISDNTVVDNGAAIPAIGTQASDHLNGMGGAWGAASDAQNEAKLAYIISLPSIADIVTDLEKTAAENGAADDLNITYDPNLGDHGLATSKYHGADWSEINITIGPSAFASGSLLYSTIRHELIHAAQHRRTDAKEQDWDGDIDGVSATTNTIFSLASFEPYGNPADQAQEDRNAFYRSMNAAISEMETHRWEYLNAAFVGDNSDAFRKGRGNWWLHYSDEWAALTAEADAMKETPPPQGGNDNLDIYDEYVGYANQLLPTQAQRDAIDALP